MKAVLLEDNVQIGDILVENQILGVATSVKDFKQLNADGILGLGFSQPRIPTIIDNLKIQNSIEKRIFSFYLQRKNEIGFNLFPNQFTLGGFDNNLIQKGESLVYCPVTHKFRWAVDINSISLQKQKTNQKDIIFTSTQTKALIDSGSSLVLFPQNAHDNILKYLNEHGNDCSNDLSLLLCSNRDIANYPNIVLNLCDNELVLNPIDYLEFFDDFVLVQFQAWTGNEDLIILGDTFMRKYYSVFDLEENRIGFALANPGLENVNWEWNYLNRLAFLFGNVLFVLLIFLVDI